MNRREAVTQEARVSAYGNDCKAALKEHWVAAMLAESQLAHRTRLGAGVPA